MSKKQRLDHECPRPELERLVPVQMLEEHETIVVAYSIRPNKLQEQVLKSNMGGLRFAYNHALAAHQTAYKKWLELPENERDEKNRPQPNAIAFRREWNAVKDTVAVDANGQPWHKQNHNEAYNSAFTALGNAYRNFFAQRAGYPKFKKKGHQNALIFTSKNNVRLADDRKHVWLPGIAWTRFWENPKALTWLLRRGARITTTSVTQDGAHWKVAFTLQVQSELALVYYKSRSKKDKKSKRTLLGIDLGLKHLLVGSDGLVIENQRDYKRQEKRAKRADRRLSRAKPGSRGREKAREARRKVYARTRYKERDLVEKVTTKLVSENQALALESLNVKGMMKNHSLARGISHAQWGFFVTRLLQKAAVRGVRIARVDRYFPSSRLCFACGVKHESLTLSDRVFSCDSCGFTLDRDLNAALNLEVEGARLLGLTGHSVSPPLEITVWEPR